MKAFWGFFFLFTALAAEANPRVVAVDGADQRAVIGQRYTKRLIAKVFDAEGLPAAYVRVRFRAPASGAPTVDFDHFQATAYDVVTLTDEHGMVASPEFSAGWGLGSSAITAELVTAFGVTVASATFPFTNTNKDGSTTARVQDIWWAGPGENGWGMSVVQHGDRISSVIFAYDIEGQAIWYVMPSARWEQGFGSVSVSPMYSPSGTPWFAYDPSRLQAGPDLGTLRMSFNGPDTMFLDDGLGYGFFGHKAMKRMPFSVVTGNIVPPLKGVGDMWWGGPSQNGWGIAILEAPGNLFVVWYTYDENFRPVWFVLGGAWVDDSTFEGGIYRTRSSAWSGRSYDASQWGALTVGTHRLRFLDSQRASLEYTLEGRSGTLTLTRQPF